MEGQKKDVNVVLDVTASCRGGANRTETRANSSAKILHKSLLENVDSAKKGGPRGERGGDNKLHVGMVLVKHLLGRLGASRHAQVLFLGFVGVTLCLFVCLFTGLFG